MIKSASWTADEEEAADAESATEGDAFHSILAQCESNVHVTNGRLVLEADNMVVGGDVVDPPRRLNIILLLLDGGDDEKNDNDADDRVDLPTKEEG